MVLQMPFSLVKPDKPGWLKTVLQATTEFFKTRGGDIAMLVISLGATYYISKKVPYN